MHFRRGRLWTVVCCALWLCAAPATAQSVDEAAEARALYDKGMAHFHLGEYEQAIEKWEAGFRLKPVPEFLYNLAQAHRLAKHPEHAIAFYRRFLAMAPRSPNRAEVERHITALETQLREHPETAESRKKEPVPAPVAEPAATTTGPPPAATTPPPTEALRAGPPPRRPLYKKAWFWGAIAGGVVVVGGVIALGVVLGTRDTTPILNPTVRF
jgi:tetratricopeptide (TPR) repeat protein